MKMNIHLMPLRRLVACLPFILLVGLFFPLQSCEKDEFRYNDRYEGDWKFTFVDLNPPFADMDIDRTWEYNGHIYRGDGDILYFHVNELELVELSIDKEGQIIGAQYYLDAERPIGGFSDRKHFAYTRSRFDQRTNEEFERFKVSAVPR
jgi:hypothetical protein